MSMDPFLRLERENAHERDKRVVFYEKEHFYEIDGKRAGLSVTGFVGRYFGHFDGLATAQKCYPKWERPRAIATQELLGGTLLKYMRIVEGVEDPGEQRQKLSVIPWMTPSRVESSFGLWQAQEDDKGYYNLIAYLKLSKKLQMEAASFDYRVEQAVYEMERRGIRLLEDKLDDVRHQLEAMIEERLTALQAEGLDGNPDSPMQVAQWLLDCGRRLPLTATGKPSTSKLALQRLADDGDELADAVIQYRKTTKLKSAFIEPLPSMAQDGILYPRTNTTRTRTGRFSCDTPNLQQIPKRGPLGKALRGCMTSPDRDGVITCDFSQVELRVAAAFANEPVLLEAFDQGRCPHTEVAAKMTGTTIESVTPESRFKAKAVNFGILNGMGAKRLAFELTSDKGTAARFLKDYKRNLPRLNDWMEGVWREAEEFRVAKTVAGRTRIFTSNEETRPAVSVIVQGSAAELIRHALVAVHDAGLEPLLTVHDEIIVGGDDPAKAEKLRQAMEGAANGAYPAAFGAVKFLAEATLGQTWGDA